MNFEIDENLPTELADDLRQLAHDADTVLGEGLRGAKDPAVVEAARASDRILFTPDKGIANVRRFPVMHPDVAEAQGFHQSVHDLVMRDGAVRCGSGRRRHEGQCSRVMSCVSVCAISVDSIQVSPCFQMGLLVPGRQSDLSEKLWEV